MKLLKQLLFPIILLVNCHSFSQQIKFNRIMPPTGGFSGFVGGVAQDKYGYMWFATRAGLFKYDGYRFKVYSSSSSNSNSLSDNRLETVFADSKGMIWIATWINGVDRLDPASGKFKHFKHDLNDPGSLSNDTVRSILEDRDGTVWIGTSGGLDKYNPRSEKFQHYSHQANDLSSLSCNRVRIIYEDKKGTIWIGTGSVWGGEGGETNEGGLNRFDKHTGKFTRYVHDPGNLHSLINNKVNAILEDSRGNFWVGTAGDGLHAMDRATGSFERHQHDPAHPEKLSRPPLNYGSNFGEDYITFINEDAVQNIWIGTLSNGINQYDPQKRKIAHYGGKDDATGFTGYSGWCFGNSADGNFWIGTYEGGLYRVDPFRNDIDHLFTSAPVLAFNEDPANGFWMGTTNGLIFQSKKTGTPYAFPLRDNNGGSLRNNSISSLFRDSEGTLWVGTGNGLCRFNPRSNNFTAYVNDPNDTNSITAGGVFVMKDKGMDSLWIGAQDGLDLMNKRNGKFIHFKNNAIDSNKPGTNFVVALLTEETGDVWVAHVNEGGLDLFDHITRRFRQFLKSKNVSSLVRDSSGRLWVGTDNGLYETKDPADGFKKFIAPAGSMDISGVLGMQEDDQNKIWISCNSGIVRIDPFTNQISVYGSNYDVDAGLLTPISDYKGLDGKIYFGALTGYYVFTPDKFIYNSKPPQVVITDFSIGGKSIVPGRKGVLNTSIEDAKEILLGYNQTIFSFAFAGIHYSDPSNNQHLYMLENYDQAWREAGSARIASYYNVPPGHYVFHVKASNNDGVWAERSIVVIISPPWWETWWFRVMSVIALVAVIYAIIKERSRKLKAENIQLEEKVNERTRQLQQSINDLKSTQTQLIQSEKMASLGELTAGIAHEIQNPLNFVNNFSEVNKELIEEMKNEMNSGNLNEAKAIANDIEENEEKIIFHGKRADSIVKGMLQHSRTTSGQKEPTDINALADEYLRLAYHGLRAKDKTFNAKFETHLDPSVGKISIVPQEIGRVMLNLINNAFYAVDEKNKATQSALGGGGQYEPLVTVSTKKFGDKILIFVADNGNGISKKISDKIFQPFFTTKPTGQGTGLGLSLAYDVIKAHGGEIKVETKEGEGSEFIIQLPVV